MAWIFAQAGSFLILNMLVRVVLLSEDPSDLLAVVRRLNNRVCLTICQTELDLSSKEAVGWVELV